MSALLSGPAEEFVRLALAGLTISAAIGYFLFVRGLYQRNYAELIGVLERSPAQKSRGETSAPISKSYLLATVYALLKDEAKARAKYEEARLQAEAAVRESPEDGP